MTQDFDLIIVGGGIMGTFHAYHALNKGLKVALLEKDAAPRGATVRNFGQIVPSGMDAKWQLYGRQSLQIYKLLHNEFDISLRERGSVYLASDQEEMTLLEEMAEINRNSDYTSSLLSKKECLEKYEGLRADYCVGGLFFPEEVQLDPRVAVHRILMYLASEKGLAYFPNHLAIALTPENKGVLARCTNGKSFKAQKAIICNGIEYKLLFPELFAQSELILCKLQMLMTEAQPDLRIPGSVLTGLSIRRYESFSACPSWKEIKAREDDDSPEKKWGVHILFKQTDDGSVIIGDTHEYADAGESNLLDFRIREEMNAFVMQEALKIFDLQNKNIKQSWLGFYTQCKNSDIFLHDIGNNIHIVTGIGGKGMTASPGFAKANLNHILSL